LAISNVSSDAIAWHGANASRFDDRYQRSAMFRERVSVWGSAIEKYVAPGSVVLDLGCGPGGLTMIAARRAGRVIAVDGSAEMLELARTLATQNGITNIEFVQSSLEEARFDDGIAELIMCSSVLEYIADPDALLKRAFRALKPGGTVLVSVPNGASLYRRLERLAFRVAGRPRYYAVVRTVENRAAMEGRLRSAGFATTETCLYGRVPMLAWLRRIGLRGVCDTLILFVARKSG
jgi:2-polyprenyl-6-hydroxyphenyl methylase/3-demethylubiquinone-9 3-methyltransferase